MPSGANGGTGGTVGDIFLNLRINQNNLGQQIQGASNSAAASLSSSIGGIFKKFVGFAAIATAVNALKEFGKAAIDVASDLVEVQNVVDTAFGEMADDCEEFAKVAIKQFGISELAAKQTASTYMAMAKSMGLVQEDASKMSINMAKLSADVASFYNLSQDEAANKLKSVFTGETEALKSLGVVMTETNLTQFALNKGIKTAYKDMDQAQKVALRYKYVMEQLELAQGDFSKTQSSWSNQTKILQEQWTQFMSTIGTGLIKVFNPLLQTLNEIVEVLNEFATTLSDKFGWAEVEEDTEEATKSMGGYIADNVSDGVEEAKKALLGLASFDEINRITSGSGDETSSGGEAFDIFGDEYTDEQKAEQKEGIVRKMLNSIKQMFVDFWEENKDDIQPWIDMAVDGFIFLKENFGEFVEFFSDLWNTRLQPLFESIGKLAKTVFQDILYPIYRNLFDTITQWWENGGQEFFEALLTFISSLWQALVNLYQFFATYLGPIVVDFVNLCVSELGKAFTFIANVLTVVLNIFTTLFDDLAYGFSHIEEVLSQAWTAIVDLFSSLFSNLADIIKQPINWIISALNMLIDAMNTLSWDVPDWVPFVGGKTFGFNIPNIPMLAEGGIVTQPTLAMIGEGKQSEAVMPLDDLREMIAQVVAEVMAEMAFAQGENNQDLYLTINLGDDKIIDKVVSGINRRTRNHNKEVILSY